MASLIENAVPYFGTGILNLSKILPNFFLSSAKSIDLGSVPIILTPEFNN